MHLWFQSKKGENIVDENGIQWIPDIINFRGTTLVFLIIELSYIRVLKGMKLPVGVKIRIDYKRVFLISEFLISGIHCIKNDIHLKGT